jgi:hypothetical protein
VQALRTPTKAGENVVIHTRLPPTRDARLRKSLIRVIGEPKNPLVLFQSDALAQDMQVDFVRVAEVMAH